MRFIPLWLCFVAVAACSDKETPTDPATGSSSGQNVGCASDPRVKTFATGLQAASASGRLSAEIMNASPSPPQRGAGDAGINTWAMKVLLDGSPPQSDVTVKTLMPDHGHGSPKVPVVTPNGDGTYTVDNIFLFMGGVWEITFTVGTESATFTLCVE